MGTMFYIVFSLTVVFVSQAYCRYDNITTDVFGEAANGWSLAAVTDFNGDKSTDLLLVNEARDTIGVVLMERFGYTQSAKLKNSGFVSLVNKSNSDLSNIVSVMPGDMNGDENMDMYIVANGRLVVFYCSCNDGDDKLLYCSSDQIQCKAGKFQSGNSKVAVQDVSLFDQPMFADVNGDWLPDVVFQDSKEANSVRTFLAAKDSNIVVEDNSRIVGFETVKAQGDVFPSLFAAITKEDLRADIMLYDAIFKAENGKYVYSGTVPKINSNFGLPTIISINNPTTSLELVLPVWEGSCSKGGLKRLVYSSSKSDTNEWQDVSINLPPDFDDFCWLDGTSEAGKPYVPPAAVRPGDYDLDGFVDLVGIVRLKSKGKDFGAPTIVLFRNVICNGKNRCFQMQLLPESKGLTPLVASFLDVTPTGRLAVIATMTDGTKTSLVAWQIYVEADLAFLKLSISGNRKQQELAAVTMPGATVRCTIASKSSRVALTPRSSHLALALPYAIYGLGQLPPYVDELAIELTSPNVTKRLFKHSLIIPNSQLVLIPYPPDSPDLWQLQSFLLINWYLFAVLITLGALAFSSTILLGGLHIRDKRIEKREKEEEAQHFHFDGM